jgi:DNA polymerase elongation subunit (family B)
VTYDFASLYPHCQLQWYIAPENYVGTKDKNNPGFCTNGFKIEPDEHVVCVNDVVFRKRNSPTIQMLKDVYSDRKKNKKIMMDRKDELKEVLDEIKKLESEIEV